MEKPVKHIPNIDSTLRSRDSIISMPKVISKASGFMIKGRRIKSILYSNDVTVISNTNADAILNVYPFTADMAILESILNVARMPVLAGIGGGLTSGIRCATNGMTADQKGASAVVLNGPVDEKTIKLVDSYIDVPIIYTVLDYERDLVALHKMGVDIFNVAGGKDTAKLVKHVKSFFPVDEYPDVAIIASGGKNEESILETIEAGANAITVTGYGLAEELFHKKMQHYREDHELY